MAIFLSLLLATPTMAAERSGFKAGILASPFYPTTFGGAAEASYAPWRLTIAAEGIHSPAVWSAWLRWRPDESGMHWGLLAGYNGAYGLMPAPMIVPAPGQPDPAAEEPGFLTGVFFEWGSPTLWLRVSPHVAWGFRDYVSVIPTMRSAFVGPALVEAGWQPIDHVELGLRLSALPVRVTMTF